MTGGSACKEFTRNADGHMLQLWHQREREREIEREREREIERERERERERKPRAVCFSIKSMIAFTQL
jgi:hypothetical protein